MAVSVSDEQLLRKPRHPALASDVRKQRGIYRIVRYLLTETVVFVNVAFGSVHNDLAGIA